MRILHLIDSLNYGGAETLMMSYLPYLKEHKHTVVVLNGPNVYSREGYDYIQLNCIVPRNIIKSVCTIREIIADNKIEVVHSHSFWTNIISRFAAPGEIKIINHYHFADYDTLKQRSSVKLMMLLDKYIGHRNLQRIAVSEYLQNVLQRIFKKKVIVISNFVKCSKVISNNKATSANLKIVSIGNLNYEKNHQKVIEAFMKLKGFPIEIDIIGGGKDLEALKAEVSKLNVNVRFLGLIPEASTLLKNYDLYLSASVSETFGVAVLEGMCAGLPLLLSDIPAYREIAPEGTKFFDPLNEQEIAEKILEGYKERTEVDVRVYYDVLRKYSLGNFLANIKELYNSPNNN